jgi:hypothetical protein
MRTTRPPAPAPSVARRAAASRADRAQDSQAPAPSSTQAADEPAARFDGTVRAAAGAAVKTDGAKVDSARVSARLLELWTDEYRVPVGDDELRGALDALHGYHNAKGFFEDRYEGTRVVGGLGDDADLEVMLAPNRKSGMKPSCGCPFCRQTAPVGRTFNWRSWRALPNAYPYAPAASQHTVLAFEGHKEQTCGPQILADMIAYQAFVDDGRGVTMHYNGTAGNSQKHLHWHSSQERLPVERWLDEGDVELTDLRSTAQGRVASYTHDEFSGLLVEGDPAFVSRWGARLTDKLATDDKTGGRYNLLLLPQKNGKARLVVVPRRVPADDMPPLGGAWAVVGRDVKYAHQVPDDYAATLQDAAYAHIVRADEFEWLRPLVNRPDNAALFVRASDG